MKIKCVRDNVHIRILETIQEEYDAEKQTSKFGLNLSPNLN